MAAAKAKEAQNETLLKDIPSLLGSAQLSTETEEITAVIKRLMSRDIRIVRVGGGLFPCMVIKSSLLSFLLLSHPDDRKKYSARRIFTCMEYPTPSFNTTSASRSGNDGVYDAP